MKQIAEKRLCFSDYSISDIATPNLASLTNFSPHRSDIFFTIDSKFSFALKPELLLVKCTRNGDKSVLNNRMSSIFLFILPLLTPGRVARLSGGFPSISLPNHHRITDQTVKEKLFLLQLFYSGEKRKKKMLKYNKTNPFARSVQMTVANLPLFLSSYRQFQEKDGFLPLRQAQGDFSMTYLENAKRAYLNMPLSSVWDSATKP